MTPDAEQQVEARGAIEWRSVWRVFRAQALHLLATGGGVALTALLLSSLAAGLQARRDEARTADLLLIMAPRQPSPALIDHGFELARRGYAPLIIVVGPGRVALRTALVERGLAEGMLQLGDGQGSEVAQLRTAATMAQRAGAASAVVVGSQAELLVWLKLADSSGLRAYGSPVPGPSPNPLEFGAAGLRYWSYALLQQ